MLVIAQPLRKPGGDGEGSKRGATMILIVLFEYLVLFFKVFVLTQVNTTSSVYVG